MPFAVNSWNSACDRTATRPRTCWSGWAPATASSAEEVSPTHTPSAYSGRALMRRSKPSRRMTCLPVVVDCSLPASQHGDELAAAWARDDGNPLPLNQSMVPRFRRQARARVGASLNRSGQSPWAEFSGNPRARLRRVHACFRRVHACLRRVHMSWCRSVCQSFRVLSRSDW